MKGSKTIAEKISRTANKPKNTQRNSREKQNRKIQLKQPKTKANTMENQKQIQTNKSKNRDVIWPETAEEGGDESSTHRGRVKDLQQAKGTGENRSQTQAE